MISVRMVQRVALNPRPGVFVVHGAQVTRETSARTETAAEPLRRVCHDMPHVSF